jgi:hypothetical protein
MIVVAEMRREARQDREGAKLRGDGSTTIWPQATFVSHALRWPAVGSTANGLTAAAHACCYSALGSAAAAGPKAREGTARSAAPEATAAIEKLSNCVSSVEHHRPLPSRWKLA